jgi:hypothetical protein
MKKLLLTILLFNISVTADIDIGEDFAPGDIVSSEVFNNKFGKIKKSIGVMTDDDLIGSWECNIYARQGQLNSFYNAEHFTVEGGGNGPLNNPDIEVLTLYSRSATVTFTEINQEPSLQSPKQWTASQSGVFMYPGVDGVEGFYMLFNDHLYIAQLNNQGEYQVGIPFKIELLGPNKFRYDTRHYCEKNS